MRILCVLCVLWGSFLPAFAVDRQAFTFTNYDLAVRVDPPVQLLEATGKVVLRNDASTPQRLAVLQISSTLAWRSITSAGKPLQYLSQPYVTDIDHTGSLTEAIVTLPREVAPRGSIELEIAYGGAISADCTRLTRIGTPAQIAARTDWDQIGGSFTAVRGAGYVAWYPIATESANLSEGNRFFDIIGAWKERHARSSFHLKLTVNGSSAAIIANGKAKRAGSPEADRRRTPTVDYYYEPLGLLSPTFAIADYHALEQTAAIVFHLPDHEAAAADYARVAQRVQPLVGQWLGAPRDRVQIVELPDQNAAPYESGPMLFTPLAATDSQVLELTLIHQLVHGYFASPRPWMYEGLAHFFQALEREQQNGRKAALAYLEKQAAPLIEAERPFLPDAPGRASAAARTSPQGQPLVTATDEIFYRTKAMFVWWMLRDMVGEQPLQRALQAYRLDQDKEPSYFQRLLEAQSHRDLEWFFDDWVYRDRGLPDFRIVSVYPRALLPVDYSVTVTVENLGDAGAEVPVIVRADHGDVVKRLEVRAREKAVVRLPVPAVPKQAIVNDGSVPESDTGNNTADIKLPDPSP